MLFAQVKDLLIEHREGVVDLFSKVNGLFVKPGGVTYKRLKIPTPIKTTN